MFSTAVPGEIKFKVVLTLTGAITSTSEEVTVNIACQASSTTVVSTIIVDSLLDKVDHNSVLPNNKYIFSAFSCPEAPACCTGANALAYKISDTNLLAGNSWTASGMNPMVSVEDAGTGSQFLTPTSTALVTSYPFYIYASNPAGAGTFSALVTLSISCTVTSTDITIGSYAAGY